MSFTPSEIDAELAVSGLCVAGFCDVLECESPHEVKSVALISPGEGFWEVFSASPEYRSKSDNRLDLWSQRIIGDLAARLGLVAIYPFGEGVASPFITWALRSGRCYASPVQFLVHDTQGLWISFRGALGFTDALSVPSEKRPSPCETCSGKLCLNACPVGALGASKYELQACHSWLEDDRNSCMETGCMVRASCPASSGIQRKSEQSAFHMEAFHPSLRGLES